MADDIFDKVSRGRSQITHNDVAEYYKKELGFDDYIASGIGIRYVLWGDRNSDNELTKEGEDRIILFLRGCILDTFFCYIYTSSSNPP